MASGAIFISYRREEAAGYAGRLYDACAARFGDERVFMDVGGIEPGADFTQQIDEAVDSCAVLLAVIGPRWASVTDARGRRRLDDPEDFIALEVGIALRRPEVTVIPVLVDDARMPTRDELPPGLVALARRQAIELSATRWRYDVATLLKTLERVLGSAAPAATEQRVIAEPERGVLRHEVPAVPAAGEPATPRAPIADPAAHEELVPGAEARAITRWGIAAGAVGVLGVAAVLVFGGSRDGGNRVSGPQPDRVRLTAGAVHATTLKLALQAQHINPNSTPKDLLDDTGVTIEYDLTTPGYRPGTEFPVRFLVYREQSGGAERFVTRGGDTARVEVESDSCACTSPFIPLPRARGRYRVEVQVFRPGGTTTEPLRHDSSKPFPFG